MYWCVFLVELRWSLLNLEDKWYLYVWVGYLVVFMWLDIYRFLCIIIFGGYNGCKFFNDVVIFDNGKK